MDAADNIRRIKEEAKKPKEHKKYVIPKVSEKRKKQLAEHNEINAISGGSELQRWFDARRKEMKGTCSHCGQPSSKNSDEYFRHSIAHIFPKRLFKSVATNYFNWLELCFWGNNCHAKMDDNLLDLTDMNCWDEIVVKFQKIYPEITSNERQYIPEILLQYLNTDM